jgi:hypothetical protein
MIDKVRSFPSSIKVKDTTGSKKYIYFQPDDTNPYASLSQRGCLAYGEIESWYSNGLVEACFYGCASLTKITECKLPSTGRIATSVFYRAMNLQEIYFSNESATTQFSSIGNMAFYYCDSLTKIDFGNIDTFDGLTSSTVSNTAFDYCPDNGEI